MVHIECYFLAYFKHVASCFGFVVVVTQTTDGIDHRRRTPSSHQHDPQLLRGEGAYFTISNKSFAELKRDDCGVGF